MTRSLSNADAGARVSATVKRYDPPKAYGFLAPDDGSPDIYCDAVGRGVRSIAYDRRRAARNRFRCLTEA